MEIVQDTAAAVRTSHVPSTPAVQLFPRAAHLAPVPQTYGKRSHDTMNAIATTISGARPSSAPCRGTTGQSAIPLSAVFANTGAATAHHSCATVVLSPQTLVTSRSSSNNCNSMAAQQFVQHPVAKLRRPPSTAAPATSPAQPATRPVFGVPIGQQHPHTAFMRAWRNRVCSSVSLSRQPNRVNRIWCSHGSDPRQDRHQQQLQQLPRGQSTGLCLSSSRLQQQLSTLFWDTHVASSADWPVTSLLRAAAAGRSAAPFSARACSSHHSEECATAGNHTVQEHPGCPLPRGSSQSHYTRAEVHHRLADTSQAGQRMCDRWQAHRMSTAVNQMMLDEDTQVAYGIWVSASESSNAGSLAVASGSDDTLGSVSPGCASNILATLAAQLLDCCTVQSSKKRPEICCICLDDLRVNELAPLLMCGHRMHRGCLTRWLSQRIVGQPLEQQAVVCPLCKQVSVDRAVLGRV